MSSIDTARRRTDSAHLHSPCHAIVLGAAGRVGSAFARRLSRDGYIVHADVPDPVSARAAIAPVYLFDCAYEHGDPAGHVERVVAHLARWRRYAAIFIPSSMWIGTDQSYGHAKLIVEELAAFYTGLGARVVTDRIGYFPGDGVEPNADDPMLHALVTGDGLYARVMARMVEHAAASPVSEPSSVPN